MAEKTRRAMLISVHGDPSAKPGGIQTGGQNIYVRNLARELSRRDWEVDVYTHQDDPAEPQVEEYEGFRIIRLAAGRPGYIPKDELFGYLPRFVVEMKGFCSQDERLGSLDAYDLVHSNYWCSGWVGSRVHEDAGISQIHTNHSLAIMKTQGLQIQSEQMELRLQQEKQVLNSTTRVVATSPYEKDVLSKRYGVDEERVRVIPCGYDPEIFHPMPREVLRRELGLEDRKMVLFAGRFAPQKGLPFLLDAFARVVRRNPSGSLLMLVAGGDPGMSPEKEELMRLVSKLGLEHLVRFLGPVDQHELARFYAAADVCAIPSVYEPFGMVALEAMACGCPVIASEVGGLAYTVRDGDTGFLVPPRDVGRLANALQRVLFDEPLRQRLSRGAIRRAGREYTWRVIARAIEEVYQEVLAS